jgi:biopolymer transport protein ExbD
MKFQFTFASFSIMLALVTIFMLAGLYSALIFGVNIALQKSTIQQVNTTKILANLLHQQGNISDVQRAQLFNYLQQLPTSIEQSNANHALLINLNHSITKVLSHYYNNSSQR